MKTKSTLQSFQLRSTARLHFPLGTALAALGLTAIAADAAVVVNSTDIVGTPTYAVTGTLLAIDAPKKSGDDGNVAGVGFAGTLGGDDGGSTRGAWEPNGTVAATQWHIGWVNNGVVTYTFDLSDGITIKNVYAKWNGQSNQSSNVVYSYNEGTPTVGAKDHDVASTGNLVLKWTDSLAVAHNTNFERIFAGDITVAGGNGFTVTVDSRVTDGVDTSKVMSLDAIVIDYVPEPASATLLGLGGLALLVRRRRPAATGL